MDDLPITGAITIPSSELRLSFARSGGPGGQNVNKVETKVEIRWNPGASAALEPADQEWLVSRLSGKLTADGDLLITSSRTRDQTRNREDARAKLVRMVASALERPEPRKPTAPGKAAVQRRLDEKRQRAEIKERRRQQAPE